jgi:antitoxin (DNA-binding transcriptional repressor) of toxin-antitoxin stability system
LVKLAAKGEEILITVRGKPMVKLMGVVAGHHADDRAAWIDELTVAAAREAVRNSVATTQAYWDKSRSERRAGSRDS